MDKELKYQAYLKPFNGGKCRIRRQRHRNSIYRVLEARETLANLMYKHHNRYNHKEIINSLKNSKYYGRENN